jgi:hypothetical protein
MSLTNVKPWIRTRMRALGYQDEWKGFDFENIPKTALNRTYHIETGDAVGDGEADQQTQDVEFAFIVRIFRAPNKNPGGLIDDGVSSGQAVIQDLIKVANRTTQSGFKNVSFDYLSSKPLNDENDNGVITEIGFKAMVILSTL